MLFNDRFPVLSIVAKVLWGIGILMLLSGVVALGAEALEYAKMLKAGAIWEWSKSDIINIVGGVSSTLTGLFTMALAEIIGVQFAIELNTRRK